MTNPKRLEIDNRIIEEIIRDIFSKSEFLNERFASCGKEVGGRFISRVLFHARMCSRFVDVIGLNAEKIRIYHGDEKGTAIKFNAKVRKPKDEALEKAALLFSSHAIATTCIVSTCLPDQRQFYIKTPNERMAFEDIVEDIVACVQEIMGEMKKNPIAFLNDPTYPENFYGCIALEDRKKLGRPMN